MKPPHISIVIANYNGEKYLDVCLRSVLKSSYSSFELLIVDDGSSDGSLKIIKKFQKIDSRISLLLNKTNMGAAASRNRAIRKTKGEIIVFLDNDTQATPNWLGELIKPLMKKFDIGGTQALLLDFEKRNSIQMAGGLLIPHVAWLAPFNHKDSYSKVKAGLGEREIVGISAALAVKREVIDTIGGFDEKEARYTEDLDFCWRIWIAGYKIVLAPKSIVYHWTKSVEQRAGMKTNYQDIYFHLARNSMRSIMKNYQLINVFKYLPFSILVNIVRGFLVLLKKREVSALVGTFSALVWNVRNLHDTVRNRFRTQKMRKYPDTLLLSSVFEKNNIFKIYKKHFLDILFKY